jgi:hypothetical protein
MTILHKSINMTVIMYGLLAMPPMFIRPLAVEE